jgi:hypothetical protein
MSDTLAAMQFVNRRPDKDHHQCMYEGVFVKLCRSKTDARIKTCADRVRTTSSVINIIDHHLGKTKHLSLLVLFLWLLFNISNQ